MLIRTGREDHRSRKERKKACQSSLAGLWCVFLRDQLMLFQMIYTFSTMSQTPQGQTPAQKPQPMHLPSSTTYS